MPVTENKRAVTGIPVTALFIALPLTGTGAHDHAPGPD
jgi:hypothetical protein